jgi:hypothetical protein
MTSPCTMPSPCAMTSPCTCVTSLCRLRLDHCRPSERPSGRRRHLAQSPTPTSACHGTARSATSRVPGSSLAMPRIVAPATPTAKPHATRHANVKPHATRHANRQAACHLSRQPSGRMPSVKPHVTRHATCPVHPSQNANSGLAGELGAQQRTEQSNNR